MRKIIIAVTVGLGLMLCAPSTAFAKSRGKRHHARSVKRAKAKSGKRSKHAGNDTDKALMTPHWT